MASFCYPPLGQNGWHFEMRWDWTAFGFGFMGVWDASFVVNVGWFTVMVWKFDYDFERDTARAERAS